MYAGDHPSPVNQWKTFPRLQEGRTKDSPPEEEGVRGSRALHWYLKGLVLQNLFAFKLDKMAQDIRLACEESIQGNQSHISHWIVWDCFLMISFTKVFWERLGHRVQITIDHQIQFIETIYEWIHGFFVN